MIHYNKGELQMKSNWSTQALSLVLLLILLLPVAITTQAASVAAPTSFDCSNVTEIPQTECEALVALYETTDGDNWTDNTGWLETNTLCSWYGVECFDNSVTDLGLTDNRLMGSIPSELSNLSNLEELWLDHNQLAGNIPSNLGSLSKLQKLALHYNQLTGSIPPELGNLSNLGLLYLQNNQLVGNIPSQLGALNGFWDLRLSNNQLTGSIPSELGNLSNLWTLDLESNQLTGNIPPELGDLARLRWLLLYNNQLTGTIPPEFGNLGNLWRLDLAANQLTGSIPAELGNLSNLGSLWLFDNQLMGSIPPELGNLSNLGGLYLTKNRLSGPVPAALMPLTLAAFTFYDTDLCVPSTGDVPKWLSSIPNLYGTGIICGESLGSLSGMVALTNTNPAADVQVNLYRSLSQWGNWRHLTTTHTAADGTYQFTELGQGVSIDYRVKFVDPTHQLAPQYYKDKPTIATADVITITPGVPRTGVDTMLALPQPPAVEAETKSGSVVYNPDGTAEITMPAPNPSDITITRAITCTVGAPSAVTLTLSTGSMYSMTNISGDLYQSTIPEDDLSSDLTLSVVTTCGVTTTESTVGYITLYDPSGYITDAQTGEPVVGATVTLYKIPGWEPKTGPDDDRSNTCQSHNSKDPGDPWDQTAPTHLGVIANADVTRIDPTSPYQHTTAAGYYGWDVAEGCWYVVVEAEGYETKVSPLVGVPPEVTDLNLAMDMAAPDLAITKSVEGTGGSVGGTANLPLQEIVTYTIALDNTGISTATDVLMTDTVPAAVDFGGWVERNGAQPLTPTGVITWGGDIAAGIEETIRFTATITTTLDFAGETITNTAKFSSTNAGSDSDDAIFTVAPAYSIYLPLVLRN
jgi:uncharacterized repeat protein (TIGR01451 family)